MRELVLLTVFIILIVSSSCTQIYPEDYLSKGDELYQQKLYNEAIAQYDLAIKGNKKLVIAYINKGMALEFQRKFEEAIINYNELLEIIPKQTEVLTRRGITYGKIQQFELGIADLEKANSQDLNNPQILCNLGILKIRIHDITGIQNLDIAISLDSLNFEAYYNRGLGKLMLQKYNAALLDFDKALLLKPNMGEAIFSKGLCIFQQGDMEKACELWRQSVKKGYARAQMIIDENCK